MQTEDDYKRKKRGIDLTNRLWGEFFALWEIDRAEAKIAANTFFVKFLMELTPSQREQTIDLIRISQEAMEVAPDVAAFCAYVEDKLKLAE